MCFTVTFRTLAIAALWGVGLTLAVIAAIYPLRLGGLAVGFMLAASTLSIRGYVEKYAADWETAYDVGREVAKVRKIR